MALRVRGSEQEYQQERMETEVRGVKDMDEFGTVP